MKTIFAFLFSLIAVAANASTWNWTNAQSTGYMPGDTVNLWGTFTTPLSLTNSGTSGSPITFYFEPNTRFSAPYWPTAGAIQFNFNSNLVVDGGVNGLIECTANGRQWSYFYPLVSWQTCQSNIGGDSPALTAWFQLHCDPHSTTNTPLFASLGASLGVPALTDTVAKGAGTNLTWLAAAYGIPALAFDAAGNARPATAAWDIGAFNAQSPGGNGQPQSGFTGYPVNWRKP